MIPIIVALCIAWLVSIAGVALTSFYRYNKIQKNIENEDGIAVEDTDTYFVPVYTILNDKTEDQEYIVFESRDDE